MFFCSVEARQKPAVWLSENASFCPKTVGLRSVNGRSNNENTDKAVYFQQDKSEIDIEITTEKVAGVGHISESQRYKNRDDITARGKFALVMALQICVAQSASNQNR